MPGGAVGLKYEPAHASSTSAGDTCHGTCFWAQSVIASAEVLEVADEANSAGAEVAERVWWCAGGGAPGDRHRGQIGDLVEGGRESLRRDGPHCGTDHAGQWWHGTAVDESFPSVAANDTQAGSTSPRLLDDHDVMLFAAQPNHQVLTHLACTNPDLS